MSSKIHLKKTKNNNISYFKRNTLGTSKYYKNDFLEIGKSIPEGTRLKAFFDSSINTWILISITGNKYKNSIGGCRYLEYRNWEDFITDATTLSKGMYYKCRLFDLPFNGGKAIILGNKSEEFRNQIYNSLGHILNNLNGEYITGLDVGTTSEDMKITKKQSEYVAADCEEATSIGIVNSIESLIQRYPHKLSSSPKILIQGIGKTGNEILKRLSGKGFRIYCTEIDNEKIKKALDAYSIHVLSPTTWLSETYDIYCPCALGGCVDEEIAKNLNSQFILGPANYQLKDKKSAEILFERQITHIPETIVSSGGVIFAANHFLTKSIHKSYDSLNSITRVLGNYLDTHDMKPAPSAILLNKYLKNLNIDLEEEINE